MPRVKLFDEQEVLFKAMNLFWKQGYSATSVQDLVKHLGINRASLYDTFGDKEQLFFKAFEVYQQLNIERIKTFFENEPEVKPGFTKLFRIAVEDSLCDKDNKGCFIVNTTTELVPGDEKMLEVLEKNKKSFEAIFYEYLKKGRENGQLKTSASLSSLASLFYTLYSGLRVVGKVNNDRASSLDSIDVVLSLLD